MRAFKTCDSRCENLEICRTIDRLIVLQASCWATASQRWASEASKRRVSPLQESYAKYRKLMDGFGGEFFHPAMLLVAYVPGEERANGQKLLLGRQLKNALTKLPTL